MKSVDAYEVSPILREKCRHALTITNFAYQIENLGNKSKLSKVFRGKHAHEVSLILRDN